MVLSFALQFLVCPAASTSFAQYVHYPSSARAHIMVTFRAYEEISNIIGTLFLYLARWKRYLTSTCICT